MGPLISLEGKILPQRVREGESASRAALASANFDDRNWTEEKRRLFENFVQDPRAPTPSDGATSGGSQSSFQPQPPPGPPPSHIIRDEDVAPPPGPPPSQTTGRALQDNPPPYHDWTSIPDTSLLPPPPSLHYRSSAINASRPDSERAVNFCAENPLFTPSRPSLALYTSVRNGDISLTKPHEYVGDLSHSMRGVWKGKTKSSCGDCMLLGTLPMYFAQVDSPLLTEVTKTIYFELRVLQIGGRRRRDEEAGIAIGYCAKPYPSWRLPGWQRASLGVHGDDGRRFVNDTWGGTDFTRSFQVGDTVGIGMRFEIPPSVSNRAWQETGALPVGKAKVEVFFTRDGKQDGGWMIDEEQDADSEGVDGLRGELDLYAAIGMFGGVEFEAFFSKESWMYQPSDGVTHEAN